MIAQYGYSDGSGDYFIAIDTDKCRICSEKPCISACPVDVFFILDDDYGDKVVAVKDDRKNKLKYECAKCKPNNREMPLPCIEACPYGAIKHSW